MAGHDSFMGRYHNALVREISAYGSKLQKKQKLNTIYFGGGTPSTYPNELLLDTFDILKNTFIINDNTEITLEVNPGTVDEGQVKFWREIGINRMSVGVQSLNDSVLKKLNRHQKASDVIELLDHAFDYIKNISIDLILGLPGVSSQEWKKTLQRLIEWPITHISMYMLEVHENTQLFFGVKSKKITLPPDDELVDLYYFSRSYLASKGFEQYEVSSFSKLGFQSKHNKAYWQRVPYKGFGLGACSFDGKNRLQNEKNLLKYIDSASKDQSVEVFSETITLAQKRIETIMLGLRRVTGVSRDEIMQELSQEEQTKKEKMMQELQEQGLINQTNGQYILSPRGLVLENEIIKQLS